MNNLSDNEKMDLLLKKFKETHNNRFAKYEVSGIFVSEVWITSQEYRDYTVQMYKDGILELFGTEQNGLYGLTPYGKSFHGYVRQEEIDQYENEQALKDLEFQREATQTNIELNKSTKILNDKISDSYTFQQRTTYISIGIGVVTVLALVAQIFYQIQDDFKINAIDSALKQQQQQTLKLQERIDSIEEWKSHSNLKIDILSKAIDSLSLKNPQKH